MTLPDPVHEPIVTDLNREIAKMTLPIECGPHRITKIRSMKTDDEYATMADWIAAADETAMVTYELVGVPGETEVAAVMSQAGYIDRAFRRAILLALHDPVVGTALCYAVQTDLEWASAEDFRLFPPPEVMAQTAWLWAKYQDAREDAVAAKIGSK